MSTKDRKVCVLVGTLLLGHRSEVLTLIFFTRYESHTLVSYKQPKIEAFCRISASETKLAGLCIVINLSLHFRRTIVLCLSDTIVICRGLTKYVPDYPYIHVTISHSTNVKCTFIFSLDVLQNFMYTPPPPQISIYDLPKSPHYDCAFHLSVLDSYTEILSNLYLAFSVVYKASVTLQGSICFMIP